MKLPLKTRILQYAILLSNPFTVSDVYHDLADEYGGEKLFTLKTVNDYVDSFLGIGFLKAAQLEFDYQGELLIHYQVTEYGKTRLKYIH